MVINHFFGISGTKVGVTTFLILGSGSAYYRVRLVDRNKLLCGVSFDNHSSLKRINDGAQSHL
jgi:hypothetical protein